jgi:hypothetical protein
VMRWDRKQANKKQTNFPLENKKALKIKLK